MVHRLKLVSETCRKAQQAQRDADAQALANGEITRPDPARRNGFFNDARIVRCKVNYKRD